MAKHEKKFGFKFKLLIAAVSVLLVFSVSVTVAYLISISSPAENTFTPGEVSCLVTETTENENLKTFSVKNTGNTEAFIRAAIVANLVDGDGAIYAVSPTPDTDYSVTLGDGWVQGSDGFYYYTKALSPGASTSAVTVVSAGSVYENGYELSIKVVASAIQASPETVAEETWGAEVTDKVIAPK